MSCDFGAVGLVLWNATNYLPYIQQLASLNQNYKNRFPNTDFILLMVYLTMSSVARLCIIQWWDDSG
jgi:hypothetical protein